MNLIYDVAHNIAKFEEHDDRRPQEAGLGASQRGDAGFPAGPSRKSRDMYREIGQPVIIPGDMGRASWVLAGQPGSMEQTFGTACHGAGRVMSRTAAVKHARAAASTRSWPPAASSPAPAVGKVWPKSSPTPTRTSTSSSKSSTTPAWPPRSRACGRSA